MKRRLVHNSSNSYSLHEIHEEIEIEDKRKQITTEKEKKGSEKTSGGKQRKENCLSTIRIHAPDEKERKRWQIFVFCGWHSFTIIHLPLHTFTATRKGKEAPDLVDSKS